MSFFNKIKEAGDKANKAVAQAHQEHKQKVAELKAKLNKALVNYKSKPTTAQADGNNSVADELTKLASLKEQGILTQAEFDKKKSELLG